MVSWYLKYRPGKAEDLDLDRVRSFFKRILSSGRVAHAYLFTGPRGTGKTSAARILAKIVNCERNRDGSNTKKSLQEPCNKCRTCKSVTNGSMVDLIEIDAASNRGIDDIRGLKEKIRLAPVGAAKKVYIIDEVHMLTAEAFNALLKTLEEPPAHAMFVLATTEAHKVPDTIKSRCVRLTFGKASESEVARSLMKVVRGEKLKIDKEAVGEIGRSMDGSFREGMKILEQLSLDKRKITVDRVRAELGVGKGMQVGPLIDWLAAKDLKKALKEVDRLDNEGVNWKIFLTEILEFLRVGFLRSVGVEVEKEVDLGKASELSVSEWKILLEIFTGVGRKMREVEIEQLPFEIAVVEWCQDLPQRQVGKVKVTSDLPNQQVAKEGVKPQAASDLPRRRVGKPQAAKGGRRDFDNKDANGAGNKHEEKRVAGSKNGDAAVKTDEELIRQWGEVLKAVKPENHSVEGLLRSTRPTKLLGNKLQIEVFYQFHMDQLQQDRFLKMVEVAVERVFATRLRLEYHLGQRPQAKVVKEVENISADVQDKDIIGIAEEIFGTGD